MKPLARFAAMLTGLVLLLTITPSWGQPVCVAPGCNPTVSDANGNNTAGGTFALSNVSSNCQSALLVGCSNTAFGREALLHNAAGNFNTAVGVGALRSNVGGHANTAIGLDALNDNTSGTGNTAIGLHALFSNFTGNQNTASGYNALLLNSTGVRNTAVGLGALQQSTGNKNIAIGYQAGVILQIGNNNIYIGNQGAGDEFQTIRIGTAQAQTFIAGIGGATVSDATVMIDTATGQLGIATSSARYKQDITPMGSRSEKVLDLRPVTFAYKDDARKVTHYGLIAEEVVNVYPELVTHTTTDEVQAVRYQELIPMLLNELQREHQEVATLRKELAELRALVGQGRGAEAVVPSATVAVSGSVSVSR